MSDGGDVGDQDLTNRLLARIEEHAGWTRRWVGFGVLLLFGIAVLLVVIAAGGIDIEVVPSDNG